MDGWMIRTQAEISLVIKQELVKDLTSSTSQGQAQVQPARVLVLRKPVSEEERPEEAQYSFRSLGSACQIQKSKYFLSRGPEFGGSSLDNKKIKLSLYTYSSC